MPSRNEVIRKLSDFIQRGMLLEETVDRKSDLPKWWAAEVISYLQDVVGSDAQKAIPNVRDFYFPFFGSQDMFTGALKRAIYDLKKLQGRVAQGEYDAVLTAADLTAEGQTPVRPSVFIAHSGEPPALSRLADFLKALGVEPVIAERLPFKGRQVPDQARSAMNGCAAAIVFATAADAATDRTQPGRGLLNETGVLQEQFGDKIIYLVEEGVQLGAMLDSYARESFTQECLEKAFHRIVIELKAHGII